MTRILIVEDNEENRYYLRALLEAQGWTVDSAIHGAEGLVKAREAPPDLVISDLFMPVMDGYTFLRQWKADARLEDVPFVVYTATYIAPADERLALSLGADDFILKPCEPESFLDRIRQVLDKSAAGVPGLPSAPPDRESALLELYSQTLSRKLEEKTVALEQTNRALSKDMAERAAVERRLRQNEHLLRIAGRAARLGGWSLDLPERVIWSDEVCSIHEVPPGTAPSLEQALAFYAPECRGVIGDSIEACTRDGVPFDLELQIITAAGRRVWVRTIGHAEKSSLGVISRVEGAFQDIDERRSLQEQLRQAQKLEAIGQLAGGIAHDFNNLLSVIVGYTSLILEGLTPAEPWHADIEEVHRAGKRATALTQQLLAFGRKQMLQRRVLDVGEVLTGVENMLKRLLGEAIDMTVILSPGLGRVLADPGQLEQIIMNLAVNARDAMPGGGKLTIEVDNARLDAAYASRHPGVVPGSYVMMSVTDTGVGMDAATRERAFEPFFTTKEHGRGTGLGLSTVFGIVKQSAGHICIKSALRRGTTFEVYLPRTDQTVAPASMPPPPPSTMSGTETVLLVEDDDQVRVMTRTVLQRHGYTVLDAQNGGEAFLICEKHPTPIHLLVTDVAMPRMSGPELAKRLASMRPDMRVLYVSGYTEDTVVQDGVLDASIDFFPKPIIPDLLLRKVREVLGSASRHHLSS